MGDSHHGKSCIITRLIPCLYVIYSIIPFLADGRVSLCMLRNTLHILHSVSVFPLGCLAIAAVVVFLFLCLSGVGWMVLSGS